MSGPSTSKPFGVSVLYWSGFVVAFGLVLLVVDTLARVRILTITANPCAPLGLLLTPMPLLGVFIATSVALGEQPEVVPRHRTRLRVSAFVAGAAILTATLAPILGMIQGFAAATPRGLSIALTAGLYVATGGLPILVAHWLVRWSEAHDWLLSPSAGGYCQHCGYDQQGRGGRCPECGRR